MAGTKEQEKRDKAIEAKIFFRQLARKNQDWNGVKEIRRWRDKDTLGYEGKENT